MESKLLSVTEWSKKNGKDVSYTRKMLREGRLEGMKVGSTWVIPEDAQPIDRRVKNGKYVNWRKKDK